jgi:trans-2-enoyl-CoA reductase
MKQIQLLGHGRPQDVCACVEVAEVGPPAAREVVVALEAAAINPADLLIMEGRYPGPSEFPAPMGIEGAGRILEVGAAVEGLSPGDLVMSLARSNWAERLRLAADQVIKLPGDLAVEHAAMLKANPPSAYLMLRDYQSLEPGDWVIQNAANSAVGRHVIRLARARGLHSINVVRREALVDELAEAGGDVVVVDGPDLATAVHAAAGSDAAIKLGIDAIGGQACARLADCLSDTATLVNYGFLSGEPCSISPHHLIVNGITLKGFWLVNFFRGATRSEVEKLYGEMAGLFKDGTLDVPIEARYGLADVKQALAHAGRESRGGKILLSL